MAAAGEHHCINFLPLYSSVGRWVWVCFISMSCYYHAEISIQINPMIACDHTYFPNISIRRRDLCILQALQNYHKCCKTFEISQRYSKFRWKLRWDCIKLLWPWPIAYSNGGHMWPAKHFNDNARIRNNKFAENKCAHCRLLPIQKCSACECNQNRKFQCWTLEATAQQPPYNHYNDRWITAAVSLNQAQWTDFGNARSHANYKSNVDLI